MGRMPRELWYVNRTMATGAVPSWSEALTMSSLMREDVILLRTALAEKHQDEQTLATDEAKQAADAKKRLGPYG